MYLYRHLSMQPAVGVGQGPPAIGELVDGIQQLKSDVGTNIMLFLQSRYFTLDPQTTGIVGSIGYIAVTPEALKKAGAQLEGLLTAAQQLGELPAGNIALADVNDTMKVLQAQPPEFYHIVVVDSRAKAKTLAQVGTNYAVLQPRLTGVAAAGAAEKGGLTTATLIGAAAGALVGGIAAGPVGAIVGGVAVGALLSRAA